MLIWFVDSVILRTEVEEMDDSNCELSSSAFAVTWNSESINDKVTLLFTTNLVKYMWYSFNEYLQLKPKNQEDAEKKL